MQDNEHEQTLSGDCVHLNMYIVHVHVYIYIYFFFSVRELMLIVILTRRVNVQTTHHPRPFSLTKRPLKPTKNLLKLLIYTGMQSLIAV